MNRLLPSTRYEELKNLAADLIEDYELAYPLDPWEIATILGIHVVVHPDGLPKYIARLCSTEDGYTAPVESANGVKYVVHLNGQAPPMRQRFTLMHEIAHIWLDHPRLDLGNTDECKEGEANFLGSYLLAPDPLVTAWVPRFTIAEISDEFQVSEEAASIIYHRVLRSINASVHNSSLNARILASATRRASEPALSSVDERRRSA